MTAAGRAGSQAGSQSGPKRNATASVAPPAQVRLGWLLGALGLLVLTALCCAYLSLCLLFAQGQWQLLYRPSTAVTVTPSSLGIAFTEARFGTNEAGVAELSGWWLPAPPGSLLAGTTVLYLHGGAGSLSDALPELARVHALGCAVFAIDYRGYGRSATVQPSEAKMVEDARQAIVYLLDTRHIPGGSLVLWGHGIGATIAAEAASAAKLPLVMEDVNPPAIILLQGDARTRWLPVKLLLLDHLDAGPALGENNASKLFLGNDARTGRLYTGATGAKKLVSGWSATGDAAIRTFLAAP